MKNLLTKNDLEVLQNEINILKRHIKELKVKLGEAAALSGSFVTKNPEYESIYNQIELTENRLSDYEVFLGTVHTVDLKELSQKTVGPYCLVTTEDENHQTANYYLTYPFITFEEPGTIVASPTSPVGKALIGKKVGETVKVQLPNKEKVLKIINIEVRQN